MSVWGFSAEGSAQYAASRNSEGSDAVEALKSGRGEVVVSTARCFTHDVSVDTYSRARFTQNFVRGLQV